MMIIIIMICIFSVVFNVRHQVTSSRTGNSQLRAPLDHHKTANDSLDIQQNYWATSFPFLSNGGSPAHPVHDHDFLLNLLKLW